MARRYVPRKDVQGTVYLLHFSAPYRHAKHYVGWAEDLQSRLEAHLRGDGANLIRVIITAGLSFDLARTWPGTRALERQIKRRKEATRLCPVCKAEGERKRLELEQQLLQGGEEEASGARAALTQLLALRRRPAASAAPSIISAA